MSKYSEILKENVSKLFKESGLTQRDFGKTIGLRQADVSSILNGKYENPTLKTLLKIGKPFGMEPGLLLTSWNNKALELVEIVKNSAVLLSQMREVVVGATDQISAERDALKSRLATIDSLSPAKREIIALLPSLDDTKAEGLLRTTRILAGLPAQPVSATNKKAK